MVQTQQSLSRRWLVLDDDGDIRHAAPDLHGKLVDRALDEMLELRLRVLLRPRMAEVAVVLPLLLVPLGVKGLGRLELLRGQRSLEALMFLRLRRRCVRDAALEPEGARDGPAADEDNRCSDADGRRKEPFDGTMSRGVGPEASDEGE